MIRREPAMAAGIVGAATALAVSYGLLTAERASLWGTLLLAALPLLQAWWTRQRVMPVSKIEDAGLHPDTITHRAQVANGK